MVEFLKNSRGSWIKKREDALTTKKNYSRWDLKINKNKIKTKEKKNKRDNKI